MADNRAMERSWERVHPFVELSVTELEQRVRCAFPGARVSEAVPLTAGLRNSNYRLTLVGAPSPVALRLYVADPEACAREAGVLAAVAGHVPAPRVWHSEGAANPPFALMEWLEGVPLDDVMRDCDGETAVSLAAACGSVLAAVHATRFSAPGFLGPDLRVVRPMPAWAPTVLSTLRGPVEERLGPELAARVRQTVESNAWAVEPVWSEAVLVHGDFKPWNMLAQPEAEPSGGGGAGGGAGGGWRLTGVLDWEFACAGSKLLDFATFLRDEAGRPSGFGDAFADAYLQAGGSLPDDWRGLTRLIDLLNLMQMLEWAGERALADLRRLVTQTVEPEAANT